MSNLVDIRNLTVRFKDFYALKDVSGTITDQPGVVGLIGPNGAGKTTLIHAIFGQEPVERGQILVNQRTKLAYCPDTPEFENYLTAREVLQLSLRLGNQPVDSNQLDEALVQVGLSEHQNRLVGGFSRGMKQRLGIAAANILQPQLLFLDEPTSALDPFGRQAMLQLISKLAHTMTVVISSHLLNDIQQIAERLLVLDHGKMIFSGSLTEFTANLDDTIEVLVKSATAKVRVVTALKQRHITVKEIQQHQIEFSSENFKTGLAVLGTLTDDVVAIKRSNQDLYHAFERKVHQNVEEVV